MFVFLQDGVTVLVASAAGLRDHPHIHDLLKVPNLCTAVCCEWWCGVLFFVI